MRAAAAAGPAPGGSTLMQLLQPPQLRAPDSLPYDSPAPSSARHRQTNTPFPVLMDPAQPSDIAHQQVEHLCSVC